MRDFVKCFSAYLEGVPTDSGDVLRAFSNMLDYASRFRFLGASVKGARRYQVNNDDAKAAIKFFQGYTEEAVAELRNSLGNKFEEYFQGSVNEEKCLAILWVVMFDHFHKFLETMDPSGYVMKGVSYMRDDLNRYWEFIGFKTNEELDEYVYDDEVDEIVDEEIDEESDE